MINEDIIKIKDSILNTVGDDCEKIILFGSYAFMEHQGKTATMISTLF
jgi:hypothetical protein